MAYLHGYTDVARQKERKIREPLEPHTKPLAPFFIEKPENTSAKEGNHRRLDSFLAASIQSSPQDNQHSLKLSWTEIHFLRSPGIKAKLKLP